MQSDASAHPPIKERPTKSRRMCALRAGGRARASDAIDVLFLFFSGVSFRKGKKGNESAGVEMNIRGSRVAEQFGVRSMNSAGGWEGRKFREFYCRMLNK